MRGFILIVAATTLVFGASEARAAGSCSVFAKIKSYDESAKAIALEVDKRGKESPCEDCHGTGFLGRIGAYETITLNSELSRVILTCGMSQQYPSIFQLPRVILSIYIFFQIA